MNIVSAFVPGLPPGAAGAGRTPRLFVAMECGLKSVALFGISMNRGIPNKRIPWPVGQDRPPLNKQILEGYHGFIRRST